MSVDTASLQDIRQVAELQEVWGHPPVPKVPRGPVPREMLQLPVWGSQGHWCSHWQGLWQPGPYQPRGHSAAGRQEDRGQGCSLKEGWPPAVCRAGLKMKPPALLGWVLNETQSGNKVYAISVSQGPQEDITLDLDPRASFMT